MIGRSHSKLGCAFVHCEVTRLTWLQPVTFDPVQTKLEIISTLLRRIGIPPPTAPPGESLCIKTGNQIEGWVYYRFDHVIHGGPKYTNILASGRGMSVD